MTKDVKGASGNISTLQEMKTTIDMSIYTTFPVVTSGLIFQTTGDTKTAVAAGVAVVEG